MSTTPSPEDMDRDAWLREALRHAPDAQAGPPPELSAVILRHAQAKARSAAPPMRPRPRWTTRLWIWLAQPAVGAGLATVMIGSVIGTMWWDRPMEEYAPRSTVAQAPVAAPAPPPPAAAAAPPDAETRKREAPAAEQALRRPPARARQAPAADAAIGAAAGTAPAPAPAPAVAANDAATQAARTADAMAPAAPAMALSASARSSARLLAKSAGTTEPALLARDFIAMRLAVSAEAQRWTWRRGDAPEQPVGDALTAWLAELDAATSTRWRPGTAPAASAEPATVLLLLREGRVMHTLRVGADRVRWDAASPDGAAPAAREAPLDAARARALRDALSQIVR